MAKKLLHTHKARYLRGMYRYRKALREHLPNDAWLALALRDDAAYFAVYHSRQHFWQGMNVSVVHKAMRKHIKDPHCPSADNIRAMIDGRPLDLFALARLHVALASPLLDGSPAEAEIDAVGLRGGLPNGSVGISLRVFDPEKFEAVRAEANINLDEMAEHLLQDRKRATAAFIKASLEILCKGCESGQRAKKGKFRISTRYAGDIRNALDHLKKKAVIVPGVDDLFPYCFEELPLGTKRGTKPLDRQSGAVF